MKQLYFLLILTLSFGVYSQGVFTYNFDVTTGGVFFKTALDAGDSTWGGSTSGDNNQKPAAAGYLGVIGNAATTANGAEAPGCVIVPGNKLPKQTNNGYSTNIYTQRYPNTARPQNNGGPAKSLGLSAGKVHFSMALKGWKLTDGSGNSLQLKLRDTNAQVVASLVVRPNPNQAGQVHFVGNVYNADTNGVQKTGGHFGTGSANVVYTSPVVVGVTVDFDNNTWEFWAGAPGDNEGLTWSGSTTKTGTFGANDSTDGDGNDIATTTSLTGVVIDHFVVTVQRPAGAANTNTGTTGADDYYLLDQIKVSAPNYVDTVNYTASVDEFMQSSFSVYPNPADNYIVLQNAIVGDKVVLFDVVGKKVKSFNVESESQQMDISELKTGVYFARSNQQEAIKIIKR
jgi:hypothetical protein